MLDSRRWASALTTLSSVFLGVLIMTESSWGAQRLKVTKVRGGKAIIETAAPLEEGKVYYFADSPITMDVNYSSEGLRSRKNSISTEFSYLNFSGDAATKTSELNFKIRYGWNYSSTEFGPIFKYQNTTLNSGSASNYLMGGFFDYNFTPNKDGNNQIYGISAQGGFGSVVPSSGNNYTVLSVAGSGFAKMFILNSQLAFRADVGLEMDQLSRSSSSASSTGFFTTIGLSAYF